ncbi:hypothetical protein J2I47_01855 [Fibrella sp. HMF5335]|uniref:Minor curlin subunit n=1 Tax=Fibrella rubiginis TaxID=2817060 RepID=A0A939GF41_9BACT|nr:hypothetical protein [Fibrella rubiginis]MBO0935283.1 hypothetical protein [Fibrella rubiginis]
MKRLYLLLFCALPLTVSAQSEVYFRQPVADRSLAGLAASELTLVQTGQLNQLQVQQTGRANAIRITQHGQNNTLDLDLTGSNNRYAFAQQGDNNLTQWRASQNNGQVDVIQRGNNNQLIQESSGLATGVSLRIEQTGGMRVLLKNGHTP